ncbi:hypothetical protein [Sporolactobacillus vineae]|jgi:cytoskeletal protein CcmA (bactofilin family)|uniref:hypothetical protein n=1 Tax=Sporolactobacillus vineae TaxID=444463 RepID=UPI000289C88A|nr:hypothetical protein [Sporolactobacillus vineae]
MSDKKGKNLKIMGETSASGGKFDKMRVMGECKIQGDVRAKNCKLMGECTIDGNLNCGFFHNMGETEIAGSLKAAEIRLIGQVHVKEQCYVRNGSIYGELNCEKDINGNQIRVRGMMRSRGNVNLEKLDMHGGIFVDGLLNCSSVDILLRFDADNYIHEIGTSKLRIRRKHSLFNNVPVVNFQADTIEGDDLDLEYTTARIVRGAHVSIGVGCKINKVEYTDKYSEGKNTEVGKVIKVLAKHNSGRAEGGD